MKVFAQLYPSKFDASTSCPCHDTTAQIDLLHTERLIVLLLYLYAMLGGVTAVNIFG